MASTSKLEFRIEEVLSPECPHGPTFMFNADHDKLLHKYKKRKLSNNNKPTMPVAPYYACSASRDQKFCPFRMDQAKWLAMSERQREEMNEKKKTASVAEEYAYLLDCEEDKTFAFCHDCCRILVNPLESAGVPKQHRFDLHLTYRCGKVTSNHPKSFFAFPSKLIRAATSNEAQAQYFFTDDVAPFLLEHVILKFGFRKVLCVGCPSIHEQILANYPPEQLNSFLLDIDTRFRQFYPSHQFARFNMFNYFMFDDPNAEEYLRQFLQSNGGDPADTIILIDPPFGGRVEYLAVTVRKLQVLMTNSAEVESLPWPAIILFFPYFNEHFITQAFDNQLQITDQIVHYSNHGKFRKRNLLAINNNGTENDTSSHNSKKDYNASSPVRVFTNLDRSKIDLSLLNETMKSDDGREFYHWCEICSRFVFRTNNHCLDCGSCSARDATKPYGHCNTCRICVKTTWSHCDKCNRCHLAVAKVCTPADEEVEVN